MSEPISGGTPTEKTSEGRLDSWKEIAAYLKRDVTTVQRWEKREGMPVHRHLHDKRGSVYALPSELDDWQQGRRLSLSEDQKEPEAQPPATLKDSQTEKTSSPAILWFVVAGLAVLVVLAIAFLRVRSKVPGAVPTKITSLAVLPLKNLSGDPTQDYFADGMTEALIGRLAAIHNLRVISHTSVMRFKNPQTSVPEIANILGVDAIVEGSVIREGSRVRVTAQLIRGATDAHFWSETYDREMQDSLTLQSEVAQTIAQKVEVTVTGEEHQRLAAARPVAPEVYESYLKGVYAINKSNNRSDLEAGVRDFEDAIKKDPTFAPAYVGMSRAYTELGSVFAGASPEQTRPKVIDATRTALKLDPDLVEAHLLLANVLQEEWQWAEAETEYRRALELNPNDADAQANFASWLLSQGRTDDAITWIRRARERDPVVVSGDAVAWFLFQSHHYEDAIRESHSVLAVNSQDASTLMTLGFALIADNKPQDAVPVLEKAASISNGSPAVTGVLIRAYAHAGRRNDALRLLAELKQQQKTSYVPAAAFVNAYLGLDQNDEAFSWLEHAFKEKSNILQYLKTHPFFDPIRNDPRFVDLVRRVGLS